MQRTVKIPIQKLLLDCETNEEWSWLLQFNFAVAIDPRRTALERECWCLEQFGDLRTYGRFTLFKNDEELMAYKLGFEE